MSQDVDVPGVGTLSFPDNMSQADMAAAIQRNYPQIHGQSAQGGGQQGAPSYLTSALNTLGKYALGAGQYTLSAGPAETAAHLGTGAIGGLAGGLGFLSQLATNGGNVDDAKKFQQQVQQDLTYQPRTDAGTALSDAADKALGVIPSALNKAGEVTADVTGSPLLGAAVNAGGNALLNLAPLRGALRAATGAEDAATAAASAVPPTAPRPTPTTPAQLLQQSLSNGRDVGYQVTPNYSPTASFLDRLGQGIAGKAQVEQAARVQNQGVTNALAARSVGQDPASLITQQSLQAIRQAAIDKGYAPIQDLDGPIQADAQFMRNQAAIKSANGDELSGNPDVAATANILMGLKSKSVPGDAVDPMTLQQRTPLPTFDPAVVTDQISTLRNRAKDAYAAGRPSAGAAFRQQAGELESLVDRHLQDLDDVSPDVLTNYRAARQLIAKTHAVEDALNTSTGNVNATALGNAQQGGAPLTGDLKVIADFANSAPGIAGVPNGSPLPTSPFNTLAGAAAAHGTGGASLALIPAARAFAAKWLLQHNDKPALLQPTGKTLGQTALDAVHGNSKAFAALYGGDAPGVLLSTGDEDN
jgi:hypothetical protein